MRAKIFKLLGRLVGNHPGKIISLVLAFTLFFIWASGKISMRNQFSDMMPPGIPQVDEYKHIANNFASASSITVVVEDLEKDQKLMKRCAEVIADKSMLLIHHKPKEGQELTFKQKLLVGMGKYPVKGVVYDTVELVERVDYQLDKDFFKNNGMIIQKTKDLKNMIDMFSSTSLPELLENINNNLEKEYVEDSENLTSLDGEARAVESIESLYKFISSLGNYELSDDSVWVRERIEAFLTGENYIFSPDNSLLLLQVQPAVSMNDWDNMLILGEKMDHLLKEINQEFPDLEVSASGMAIMGYEEMEFTKKDMGWSSVIALVLILVLLIGSFRSWKHPFFSVVVLIISLIWVTGILALSIKYLNMMSASFGLILIGLGIDFGIHMISGYKDARDMGFSVKESLVEMYLKVGSGVMTGAVTTAIVFFTLILTRFNAISEMGIAIGTGIMVCFFLMLLLLPAMISWEQQGFSLTGKIVKKLHLGFLATIFRWIGKVIVFPFKTKPFQWISSLLQFEFLEKMGTLMNRLGFAISVLVLAIIIVIMSYFSGKKIDFEYDMMELEPKNMPSVICQKKIIDKFEISPDFAMLTVSDLEESRRLVQEYKKIGNRTGLIGQVDAITEIIQSQEIQKKNIPLIEAFKETVKSGQFPKEFDQQTIEKVLIELERLHFNLVEMGELSISSKGLKNKIIKKCDDIVGKSDEESKILQMIERMKKDENLINKLNQYQAVLTPTLKENLLQMSSIEPVTIESVPDKIKERYLNESDSTYLISVVPNDNIWEEKYLRKFSDITAKVSDKITGYPIITLIFIDLIQEKGKTAIWIGFIAILLFLTLDFLSLKYTLIAIVPLIIGATWMVGLMTLLGVKFNYNNFMALPLILGIGIDDAVHILHRYRLEGKFSIPVVMKHTGRAILLTSLTTGIGFGSMGLATHRGLASMGQVLVFGVGSCFVSSVLVLPAIITIYEKIFKSKRGAL